MTTQNLILINTPDDPIHQEWNEREWTGFLHTLTTTSALSQDGQTLTLDNMQLQIFNELQGKLQDILRVVKAIVVAHKKG